MLIYILLILGQIFANQDVFTQVNTCTESASRILFNRNTSKEIPLQTVVESCIKTLGIQGLKVKEALVSGNTHTIKLSLGRNEFFHSFNIIGTKLCNQVGEAKGKIQSVLVDVDLILSQTDNSVSANSCWPMKSDAATTGATGGGFGFEKSVGGKCKKTCPDGQILVGTTLPFLFTSASGIQDLAGLSEEKDYKLKPANFDRMLMNTQCVACPKDKKNVSHIFTKKDSNYCIDQNGCAEGTEYFAGSTTEENFKSHVLKGGTRECLAACSAHKVRDNKGKCVDDPKKACEELNKMKVKLQNISSRFMAATQTSKLGRCDMNNMRSNMQAWSSLKANQISKSLSSGCSDHDFHTDSRFYTYLRANHSLDCLGKIEESSELLDLNIYNLLHESIYSQDTDAMRLIN